MKTILFFIALIWCSNPCIFAQKDDYSKYFELTVESRDLLDEEKYQEAKKLSDEAFNLVNLPPFRDLEIGVKIALKLKDTSSVFSYCSQMAKNYGRIPGLRIISDTAFLEKLEDQFENEMNIAIANYNVTYSSIIDSLNEEDQSIRKAGPPIYKDGINTDSLRTMHLLSLIEKYGFPERSIVGSWGYNNAMSIFLHADFDLNGTLLDQLLLENVMNGKMDPMNYASIVDRRCNFRGERPYYYQIPVGYNELHQNDKEIITARRRKIGLRSVEKSLDIEILPNGDMVTKYKY